MKWVSIVFIVLILGSGIGVLILSLQAPSVSPYSLFEHYADPSLPSPSPLDISDAISGMYMAGEETSPEDAEAIFHFTIGYFRNADLIGQRATYAAREAPCASTSGIVLYLQREHFDVGEADIAFAAMAIVEYLESSEVYLDPCARNNIEKIRALLSP